MDLCIVRHAWAEDRDFHRWPDDDLRPLTPEGKERFAKVVKTLVSRRFAPDILATSPLVRCRQTAAIVAQGLPEVPKIVELDALQPGSAVEPLLAWTVEQVAEYDKIAWVGHAPDVGWLTAALIGDAAGRIEFAKGAVAAIRFDASPAAGQGRLRWLVTAKTLGC